MLDVYFYEAFEEEEQALKSYLPDTVSAGFSWKTIQEKGDNDPPAKVISIRTQSQIPIKWASQLSGILSRSTGYDHLVKYLKQIDRKIALSYLPLYCSRAVAEHAMLLWMSLLRKLPRQIKQFQTFDRDGLTGIECQEKKLLIVGVGNIGSEIAKIGQGLAMEVMGVDLVEKFSFVNYYSIHEVLPKADIIVCAMNLTDQNVNYFNYDFLRKTKTGVIFINIARGEMSPAQDLQKLLDEGHLGGLGMDVYSEESELGVALRSTSASQSKEIQPIVELSKRENVIFTPHNAFNTAEAVARKAEQSIEQICTFLNTNRFIWPLPGEST